MEDEILNELQDIKAKLEEKKTPWAKFVSFTEKILIPGALVALAIVTHLTSKQLTEAQIELTKLQQDFEQQRDQQLIKNEQSQLDLMYLNLFYEELSKSEDKENTLKLLELLNQDLQVKLAEWIKSNETYNKKTRDKAKSIITKIEKLENYKIGIYFLQSDKKAQENGKTIKANLEKNNIGNSIQLYPKDLEFFKKVNPPTSNEIRYELNFEESASLQLQKSLNELFPNLNFERKTVRNRTTNFISIFIK